MKRVSRGLALIGGIVVIGLLTYANWPEKPLSPNSVADKVLILKGQRALILLKDGRPLKEYCVSLSKNAIGRKEQEGDKKTPEGIYTIDYRNPKSSFHLSLHISYPNADDVASAKAKGVSPGSLIMIHGLRNGLGLLGKLHRLFDWTGGCIAVTNPEIEEICCAVKDGTPVEIRP